MAFALLASANAQTPKSKPAAPQQHSALVPFRNAPFPYHGENPEGKPFFDVQFRGQRGHHSSRGGIYWEKETYSDRRALVVVPPKFDARKPATLVVFLHGNEATLERDVRARQQVPQQLARSGLNAVLVAPQLAYDARDSSPGRFWVRGAFSQFLDEAADQAAAVAGDARLKTILRRAPVILVAYSGGYYPAAFALNRGGADHRLHGVVLLDALYGEEDKFADWVIRHHHDAFFVSAYTEPARASNEALQNLLRQRKVEFTTDLPQRLAENQIHFLSMGSDVVHEDVVTQAWTAQPLADVLRRAAVPPPAKKTSAKKKGK
jgi:hypothetical protein